MLSFRAALIGLAPLALCACASVDSAPSADRGPQSAESASPYGLFLAGQAAENYGQSGEAANLFARAADAGPGPSNGFLAGQAFTSALLAGDVGRAAAAAPTSAEADKGLVELGALVQGVNALSEGRGKLAKVDFTRADADCFLRVQYLSYQSQYPHRTPRLLHHCQQRPLY